MARAEDAAILEFVRQQGAVVATLDSDFHAILVNSGARGPSVIRLRKQGLDAEAVAALLQTVLAWFSGDLKEGCRISVKPPRITRRRLPIGRVG